MGLQPAGSVGHVPNKEQAMKSRIRELEAAIREHRRAAHAVSTVCKEPHDHALWKILGNAETSAGNAYVVLPFNA